MEFGIVCAVVLIGCICHLLGLSPTKELTDGEWREIVDEVEHPGLW